MLVRNMTGDTIIVFHRSVSPGGVIKVTPTQKMVLDQQHRGAFRDVAQMKTHLSTEELRDIQETPVDDGAASFAVGGQAVRDPHADGFEEGGAPAKAEGVVLETMIDVGILGLPERIERALRAADVDSVQRLEQLSDAELLVIDGIGAASVAEIREAL